MKPRWIRKKAIIAPIAILALAAVGFAVMYLWNWLAPAVFGGHAISYWQAWGLIILSRVFFGRFGGRPGDGGRFRHRMRERLEQMTPEEREKFLQGMGRCGPTAAGPAQA